MSGGFDFQEKANRLLNRLSAINNPIKSVKTRSEITPKSFDTKQLFRIKEEIEISEIETKNKMEGLNDTLKKIEVTLVEESKNRSKMDQTFTQTVAKLERNLKNVLSNIQKIFSQKEKKLEQKIQLLLKSQKKQIEDKLHQNQQLVYEMEKLENKVITIFGEATNLRKTRIEVEQKINKQFLDQIKELKRIFEVDIHEREDREGKSIASLKNLYKNAMERIYAEERERQANEVMLMGVVQQLVNHILQS